MFCMISSPQKNFEEERPRIVVWTDDVKQKSLQSVFNVQETETCGDQLYVRVGDL